MLYLMRKIDESIIINNDIELKVIEIKGKSVKLGFDFPKGASVLRKELYDKIMAENKSASEGGKEANIGLLSTLPKLNLGGEEGSSSDKKSEKKEE
jgi:carbon storage regulator